MIHLLVENASFKLKDKKKTAERFNHLFKAIEKSDVKPTRGSLAYEVSISNMAEENDIELILSSILECDVELFEDVPTIIFSDTVDAVIFVQLIKFIADLVEPGSYITIQDLNTHELTKYIFHNERVFLQRQKLMWDEEQELNIKNSDSLV